MTESKRAGVRRQSRYKDKDFFRMRHKVSLTRAGKVRKKRDDDEKGKVRRKKMSLEQCWQWGCSCSVRLTLRC